MSTDYILIFRFHLQFFSPLHFDKWKWEKLIRGVDIISVCSDILGKVQFHLLRLTTEMGSCLCDTDTARRLDAAVNVSSLELRWKVNFNLVRTHFVTCAKRFYAKTSLALRNVSNERKNNKSYGKAFKFLMNSWWKWIALQHSQCGLWVKRCHT